MTCKKTKINTIKGFSMHPIIKDNCRLVVNLYPKKYFLGDIVIYFRKKTITAHRIIKIKSIGNKKGNCKKIFTIKGDNLSVIDGNFQKENFLGKVETILYPTYKINLNSKKNIVLKYFFVIYSIINLKIPFVRRLKKISNFKKVKNLYRSLVSCPN